LERTCDDASPVSPLAKSTDTPRAPSAITSAFIRRTLAAPYLGAQPG
jgi:hypothetical protein